MEFGSAGGARPTCAVLVMAGAKGEMNLRIRRSLSVLGLIACVGCRSSAPAPVTGAGSFAFVSPPLAPSKTDVKNTTMGPGEVVMAAEPILPLATPIYPREAFALRPGQVTVGVRLTVDPNGRVVDVGTSLAVFSSPNSYRGGFREAVEAAVKQWRFESAVLQHSGVGKDATGRDVIVFQGAEKIEWVFDVAFTFTASGDVVSGLPGMTATTPPAGTVPSRLRAFFVRLFNGRVLSHAQP